MSVIDSWDDGRCRRWLARSSGFDVDAMTDDQVREGALLLADVMDASCEVAETKKENIVRAVEWLQQCEARLTHFVQQLKEHESA